MTTTTTSAENDHVLVLHAPDGTEWARFLANRLATPSYNIHATLVDITDIPESPTSPKSPTSPSQSSSPPSSSSSSKQTISPPTDPDYQDDAAIYTNEEALQNENDDSVYKNDDATTIIKKENNNNNNNNNNIKILNNEDGDNNKRHSSTGISKPDVFISQSIDQSRVCAIFISPDIVENENAFCVDVESLNEKRTVFLFLGVELGEVMKYFGPLYNHVTRCRCCFIDGTEDSIRLGIVSIIEAYEDDEEDEDPYNEEHDLYKTPNQPVQRNTIEKVFPRMLTETERDVFVLLSRIPEDSVQVVLVDNDVTLQSKSVCERLYSFVVPPDIHGVVTFQLECQGRRFGEDFFHSYSKLDLIQSILTSEINPHSLIASSLGLDKDDVGGLDTALAFKLQELAPVMTFKALCPCEEALKDTEEQSDKMWPTLLHFAAEFNLRLLCSELLRYPGMAAAACTENRAGEFPCQIANKKGFFQLENDLIEFMKRLRREVDPDYVSSTLLNHHSSSLESSNTSLSELSTNPGPTDDSSMYFDMAETQRLRKPLLDRIRLKPRAMSESSLFREKQPNKKKSVKNRSLSGHNSSRPPQRTLSDRCEVSRSRPGYSHRPLPRRPDSPSEDTKEETYSNPDSNPDESTLSNQGSPTSLKALKRLGVTEQEVASRYSILDPKLATTSNMYSATCPPGTLKTRLFEDSSDRHSVSSNCDDNEITAWNAQSADPKRGHMKEKVKGFFQKMKGSKKSGNAVDVSGKKPRRGSEPTSGGKVYSKNRGRLRSSDQVQSFDEERDSGINCDAENKPKVFVESKKPMMRRISRRIEYAKRESYGADRPQLPIHPEEKRATFKSFIL